jgi:glycogen synthase
MNYYHSYDYSFNKFRNCGYISRDVNLLKQLFIPTHRVNMLGMSLAILIALLLRYVAFYNFFLRIAFYKFWLVWKKLCNIVSPSYFVQIPGERSLGTFNLDILNDDVHVLLPSTSEVNTCLQIWLACLFMSACFIVNKSNIPQKVV